MSPGGTSNDDPKSPSDFSDGKLLSTNDYERSNLPPPDNKFLLETLDAFSTLEQLMNKLSANDIQDYMSRYAARAGFTLIDSNTISPADQQPNHYTVTHNDPNMYHQDPTDPTSTLRVFDGRETPLTTGFSPNVENFSQRQENPIAPSYDMNPPILSTNVTIPPGPAGTRSTHDATPPSTIRPLYNPTALPV